MYSPVRGVRNDRAPFPNVRSLARSLARITSRSIRISARSSSFPIRKNERGCAKKKEEKKSSRFRREKFYPNKSSVSSRLFYTRIPLAHPNAPPVQAGRYITSYDE